MRMGYVSTVAPSLAAALRKKTSPGLARGALPSPAGAAAHARVTGPGAGWSGGARALLSALCKALTHILGDKARASLMACGQP